MVVYSIKLVDSNKEVELEIIECPECNGAFGVDATYFEQVDDVVSCPMCKSEVDFNWYEKQGD